MNNYEINNFVELIGTVTKDAVFSHSVMDEKFFETEIAVARLSNERDYIPLLISENDLNFIKSGERIYIRGQYRSYNKFENNRSRLLLTVFAKSVAELDKSDESIEYNRDLNKIVLNGFLCKQPIYRETPLKREITDVLIAVNRNYQKSDYIPAIFWGKDAAFASTLSIGDPISIEGRIQSREYTKCYENGSQEKRMAYEVSVMKINQNEDVVVNYMYSTK